MQTVTTITPKFQVHIPIAIRKKIVFKKHGRATIEVKQDKIIIAPVKDDFISLGGTFRVKKPTPAEKIRQFINYSDKK